MPPFIDDAASSDDCSLIDVSDGVMTPTDFVEWFGENQSFMDMLHRGPIYTLNSGDDAIYDDDMPGLESEADTDDDSVPGLIESGAIAARPRGPTVADTVRLAPIIVRGRTQFVYSDAHLYTNADEVVVVRPGPVDHLADLMSRGVAIHRLVPSTIQFVDDWLIAWTASPAFNMPVREAPVRIPRWLTAWTGLPALSAQNVVVPVRRPRIVWNGSQGSVPHSSDNGSGEGDDIEIVD